MSMCHADLWNIGLKLAVMITLQFSWLSAENLETVSIFTERKMAEKPCRYAAVPLTMEGLIFGHLGIKR